MRRIWLAIRIFFLTLFKAEVARRVAEVLAPAAAAKKALTPGTIADGPSPKGRGEHEAGPPAEMGEGRLAARSEAVTLLATLQREGRLVDFLQEPLEGYSDAQIGAAARDVHRQCGQVLQRLFALRPIVAAAEEAAIEVPAGFDGGRYRLTGNVAGGPPFHGRLVHHGWEAEKCQLPAWSGTPAAARVVAPVEVEL
jgi:hypothetical protein